MGSDAHNVGARPPRLVEAAALIEKKLGPEVLAELRRTEESLGLL